MQRRLPSKKILFGLLSALVAIALLVSVIPAMAAGAGDENTPIPGMGRVPNPTLVRMHNKLGSWFNDQEDLLREADGLSQNFQALIDVHQKAGKNVTILENGLATFEAEVAASREIHLVAGAAIFSTAGFKVNGDVRDRLVAGQQLLDGHASLKDAHFRLAQAIHDLRKTFTNWRHTRVTGIPWPTAIPTP